MDEIRKLFGELERERGESGSTYRRRVRKQFVKMDENDDGLICRRELRHAFKRLDLHLDPEVLDTAMETFDMDDDGRISFSDFLDRLWIEDDKREEFEKLFRKFRNRLLEIAQKSSLRQLFYSFAEDSDRLDSKEFFDSLHDFGLKFTKVERQTIWEGSCTSLSLSLSLLEHTHHLTTEFDLSHDSYISLNEFHDALTFPRTEDDYEAERKVKKALRKLMYKLSENEDCDPEDVVEDIFDEMDEDHDGKVEVSEFGTTRKGKIGRALYRCMCDISETQKRRIFYRIDVSGDGTLGLKELREYLGDG